MAPDSSSPKSWGERAQAAADATAREQVRDEFTDEIPKQGDRVDHFAFGLCDVIVVRGKALKIRPVRGGKLREVRTDVLRIACPEIVGADRVFRLLRRER